MNNWSHSNLKFLLNCLCLSTSEKVSLGGQAVFAFMPLGTLFTLQVGFARARVACVHRLSGSHTISVQVINEVSAPINLPVLSIAF